MVDNVNSQILLGYYDLQNIKRSSQLCVLGGFCWQIVTNFGTLKETNQIMGIGKGASFLGLWYEMFIDGIECLMNYNKCILSKI